jgi:6-pyruvoyltetrahydropterin/6-carboxytetrahydropterin synthase
MIQTVKASLVVPYAHRLHGYAGRCSRLHGHNGLVTLVLAGAPNGSHGFVADFYDVRFMLQQATQSIDHTLVVSSEDPLCELLRGASEAFEVSHVAPTAEYFARRVFDFVSAMGAGQPWRVESVEWEEEPGFTASVRGATEAAP